MINDTLEIGAFGFQWVATYCTVATMLLDSHRDFGTFALLLYSTAQLDSTRPHLSWGYNIKFAIIDTLLKDDESKNQTG